MEKIRIVVSEGKDDTLSSAELINFLWLFQKAYSGYAQAIEKNQLFMALGESYFRAGERAITEIDPSNFDASTFDPDIEKKFDFKIVSINKNSPMEIMMLGIPIALTAAVILSGGKVKISEAEFELPPIGTGIKSLRKALGHPGKMPKRIKKRDDS